LQDVFSKKFLVDLCNKNNNLTYEMVFVEPHKGGLSQDILNNKDVFALLNKYIIKCFRENWDIGE